MVDPEPAGFLVGRTEGQGIAFGMGEKGGVKIAAQPPLTAKVHPRLKMPGLQFVPVGPCSIFKYGVAGVKIQLFRGGAELQDLVDILHQLLWVPRPAGVISGSLNTVGKWGVRVGVKALHIVPLPAVQGNRDGFELFNCRIGVNADGGVFFFCICVAH